MFSRFKAAWNASSKFESAQHETNQYLTMRGIKPSVFEFGNLLYFFRTMGSSFRLMCEEPEIFLFTCLQWLVIVMAYLVWTDMLDWIPDSLWDEVHRANERNDDGGFKFINLILIIWSFFVIAATSYPLAILNGAITASHYLRSAGKESNIRNCLIIGTRNVGRSWVFTTIDAWITVNAILDRMPRKRNNRTAADEALYYAWKIGTMGIFPALVAGRTFTQSALDTITLFKKHPFEAIGLRMGYSAICWVIGILTYVATVVYLSSPEHDALFEGKDHIYRFYQFIAIPTAISTFLTAVLVRPFYLIALSGLYVHAVSLSPEATDTTHSRFPLVTFVVFASLVSALLTAYTITDHLGLRTWIETMSRQDIATYRTQNP